MRVDIGAVWPEASAPDMAVPGIARLARCAEEAGLDCFWSEDRLAVDGMRVLDAALTLAAAAAVTSRIALGFAIYVPSMRPLAWAARQIATLQHIAGGNRLRLGVGLGGGPEHDFQAAGARRSDRVRRTDEFLTLLPGMLAGQPTVIPGVPGAPVVQFGPAVPVPPVWVGGTSQAALERAVRFGDGWLSGLQTPQEFAAGRRRLDELSAQAGRAAPRAGITIHAAIGPGPGDGLADVAAGTLRSMYGLPADRARQLTVAGPPAQVADQLAPFVQAGAELIAVVCNPVPTERSWELLAEVRQLLHQQ